MPASTPATSSCACIEVLAESKYVRAAFCVLHADRFLVQTGFQEQFGSLQQGEFIRSTCRDSSICILPQMRQMPQPLGPWASPVPLPQLCAIVCHQIVCPSGPQSTSAILFPLMQTQTLRRVYRVNTNDVVLGRCKSVHTSY